MTVEDLQEWLESAQRESDRDLSEYIVEISYGGPIYDGTVDHAKGTISFWAE